MKILPLSSAQASFIEIEIIGRYIDDDDDNVRRMIEVVADHFERTSATGKAGLALPDVTLLRVLILDVINNIADAVEDKRSEEEGYGNGREAMNLHRTGSALLKKLRGYQ